MATRDEREGDRHRRPPMSIRMPERVGNLMDLARGKQSRNQFMVEAIKREIRRKLGNEVLRDED